QLHEKEMVFEVISSSDAGEPRRGGVVEVTTTVVDTGEKKQMFGRTARHLKTTVKRDPKAGACESQKQTIETDGWYVDLAVPAPEVSGDCKDEIRAKGSRAPAGFPFQYTMTTAEEGAAPVVISMEVTEFSASDLDAGMFDVPPGFREGKRV